MNQFLQFLLVAIFSIFVGSQITEGFLLVPYWQSLSPNEFHSYYSEFGPLIGKFYSILTIIAAVIPILLSLYCKLIKSKALGYALTSSFFSILFVSCFFIYFKGANEQFYQAALTEVDLKNQLRIWQNWHWCRVVVELISLFFLVLAFIKIRRDGNISNNKNDVPFPTIKQN